MELRKRRKIYLLIFLLLFASIIFSILTNRTAIFLNVHDLEGWIGEYEFFEHIDPHYNMAYSIVIFKKDKNYYADLSIDGWMTIVRIRAEVIGDKNEIDLLFDEYLPDNRFESYQKNERLLSLKRDGKDLITFWGKMQPMAEYDEISGKKIFFTPNKTYN